MFKNIAVLVLSALMAACHRGSAAEQQEIRSNLLQAGFPENDIQLYDGDVYVGRDAHVTLEASRELRLDALNQDCGLPSNLVDARIL